MDASGIRSRDVARVTLVVAATAFGLWLLYQVRQVILLAGVSIFLAIALEPAVSFLQRFVRSRGLSVLVLLVILLLAIVGFVAAIGPPLTREVGQLADDLPRYASDLQDDSTALGRLERRFDLTGKLESAVSSVTGFVGQLGVVVGAIFTAITNLLVVTALTVSFLARAPQLKAEGLRFVPAERRQRTAQVMEEIFAKVGGWLEGNVLTSLIAGIVSFIAMVIIGVPYPAALAIWVAITDLVPMIGALFGALVCVTVAFFDGVGTGIATLVFFLIYQQLENLVIQPRMMKRTVDLSATAVILSALIGGALLGPLGVLLGVPGAAAVKILFIEIFPPRQALVTASEHSAVSEADEEGRSLVSERTPSPQDEATARPSPARHDPSVAPTTTGQHPPTAGLPAIDQEDLPDSAADPER